MTKIDIWKFSSDSLKDTDEDNKRKKDILVRQSSVEYIVSANNFLIHKGKVNPHHHSISTKDLFHTIIKNTDQILRIQISKLNY